MGQLLYYRCSNLAFLKRKIEFNMIRNHANFIRIVFGVASLALMILATAPANSHAQRPPRKSLAVDEVLLNSGKRMYGIVLAQDQKTGVQLMVNRTWFAETYANIYKTHVESEVKTETDALTEHLFRLEAWWKSRVDDIRLVEFADEEMERIENLREDRKQNGAANLKPFTVVQIPMDEIKSLFRQSAARHKIAGLAWKHKIERVSSRPASALKRELLKQNVDVGKETFDLSSQLSANRRQSSREWNARLAILEYRLRDQLHFQGVGENLIRIDPAKPAGATDMQALLGQFMGSSLGGNGQVNELLGELGLAKPVEKKDWWAKAAKIAKKDGFTGFAVKRLIQDFSSATVKVEYCFFAETKTNQWEQIATIIGSASRDSVDEGVMARIKADPQVESVLKTVENLGLHSGDAIEKAIRQGAATEAAMSDAQDKFDEFIDRYGRASDSPILNF